jgi:addiction module RelB/DinJ family antitoxin
MKTVLTTFKTDPKVKEEAKKIAAELGFSLSAILNAYLKKFIREKSIYFTANEEPTEYLINSIKEAKEEIKRGEVSPGFDNAKDAIDYLRKERKK